MRRKSPAGSTHKMPWEAGRHFPPWSCSAVQQCLFHTYFQGRKEYVYVTMNAHDGRGSITHCPGGRLLLLLFTAV